MKQNFMNVQRQQMQQRQQRNRLAAGRWWSSKKKAEREQQLRQQVQNTNSFGMPGNENISDSPLGTGWQKVETLGVSGSAKNEKTINNTIRQTIKRRWLSQFIEGEARGLSQRFESASNNKQFTIWSFRVEQYDSSGNRLNPVPVEMKGLSFSGFLSEGDRVRVRCKKRAKLPLRPQKITNLTTNSKVISKRVPLLFLVFGKLFNLLLWLLWIAAILFIITVIIRSLS